MKQTAKESFVVRKKCLAEVEMLESRHIGCVRINSTNSFEHEITKFHVCRALNLLGKDFITEAKFTKNRGRCDILCLDGTIYEILKTETQKDFKEKTKKYPEWITIIPISVGSPIDEILTSY